MSEAFRHWNLSDFEPESERVRYDEFLRVKDLSAGVYLLPAGSVDGQKPHTEDEVYFVARGRGRFFAGGEDIEVSAGSILFVKALEEHRFHEIAEDLHVIVFFAPPEGSLGPA